MLLPLHGWFNNNASGNAWSMDRGTDSHLLHLPGNIRSRLVLAP